jgi:hypothetical protein
MAEPHAKGFNADEHIRIPKHRELFWRRRSVLLCGFSLRLCLGVKTAARKAYLTQRREGAKTRKA